jgi:renalase
VTTPTPPLSIAVIGAGLSGSACAARLHRAGAQVTLLDKSRGLGGRMSTRRTRYADAAGVEHTAEFDHGAQHFSAHSPAFQAALADAEAAGSAARWTMRDRDGHTTTRWVATPQMPALSRHLVADLSAQRPPRLGHAVTALRREGAVWHLTLDDGSALGPFDRVVLAIPPAQAAVLLAEVAPTWAATLAAADLLPCWTLMAVTPAIDLPWDATAPTEGPLAWIARNDRKPGRSAPAGSATWVAQATADWTRAHLKDDAASVTTALQQALATHIAPPGAPAAIDWQHSAVHRWLYALPAAQGDTAPGALWDAALGLGVCGDHLGGGQVEAAWQSGEQLAVAVLANVADAAQATT